MDTQSVRIKKIVKEENFASVMKSGSLDVLATPALIAWMEEAACECLTLEEGSTSVGIAMNMSHEAASPLDAEIEIEANVIEVKGRIIQFEIQAYQGDVCIGKATHTRCVVDAEKFIARTYQK